MVSEEFPRSVSSLPLTAHCGEHHTPQLYTAGSSQIFRLSEHIDQCCFSCCAVPADNGDVSFDHKFIAKTVIINDNLIPFRAVVTTCRNVKNFAGPVKCEKYQRFNSAEYLFYRNGAQNGAFYQMGTDHFRMIYIFDIRSA